MGHNWKLARQGGAVIQT